jgi:hypothetical protein
LSSISSKSVTGSDFILRMFPRFKFELTRSREVIWED